jgi:predicted acylesterase/phospholipase RssA
MPIHRPIFTDRIIRPAVQIPPPLNIPNPNFTRFVDGVFEGGGTLGAAYTGSLVLMQEAGIWFKRVAGNSAGAITAAMVAAGYTAAEIEWLTSSFPNPRIVRPATLPQGLKPISFMEFLDLPSLGTLHSSSKRKTLLWKALKGQAIDNVLNTKIPIPTRGSVINKIINIPGLGVAANAVKPLLEGVLSFLPTHQPRLSDFSLFDEAAGLRTKFADTVWNEVAKLNPLLVISTQFLHEGSILEGKVFLDTMENLLRAKLPGAGKVKFKDLKIPLAVIACNYDTKQVVVYSSRTDPNMQVAEAVRRSMSIPLIFQPRKVNPQNTGRGPEYIVDGGVASNFPIWLYTPAGDRYWPPASVDHNRPKIGFSLEEEKSAPPGWAVAPAKFGNRVETIEIIVAVLIAQLKELGLFVPSPSYGDNELKSDLIDLKFLEVLMGYLKIDKELAVRQQLIQGLMSGMSYFDVEIPLRGFHWLDFDINSDRSDMAAIAERGFMATRDALSAMPTTGLPLINDRARFKNPF